MSPRVQISMVTFNSAEWLADCLNSLKAQTFRDFRLFVWDNASTDNSAAIAEGCEQLSITMHRSRENTGYCAGHNGNIALSDSDYVLTLNPDVYLEPCFLEILVKAMDQDARAGSATGKIWRWPPGIPRESIPLMLNPHGMGADLNSMRVLDSTGIYLIPTQRHLDRGSGLADVGQYDRSENVFGASGAAAFYRRAMLNEIKYGREYFDEAFFAYREDADLAWRAQWLGWTCLYVAEARALHVRRVLPERRASLHPDINMHSFKNRFLLRIKNMDAGTYLRFFIPISARDLGAIIYVLLREPGSLRAFPLLMNSFPRAWAARRYLQKRRRVSGREIRAWFSCKGLSKVEDWRRH
jgi:GT2 family glycosyltransferase